MQVTIIVGLFVVKMMFLFTLIHLLEATNRKISGLFVPCIGLLYMHLFFGIEIVIIGGSIGDIGLAKRQRISALNRFVLAKSGRFLVASISKRLMRRLIFTKYNICVEILIVLLQIFSH